MYLSEWEQGSNAKYVKVVPKCLWPVSVENLLEELDVMSRVEFTEEVKQRCTMIWDEECRMVLFVTPNTWAQS